MKKKRVIVKADSKFHSDAPFTDVVVVFSSDGQVQALIRALNKLLSDPSAEWVELEDNGYSGEPVLEAAIYIHKPGFHRDDAERRCRDQLPT